MLHWELGPFVSVVGLLLTLIGLIRPRRLTGHDVLRISAGVTPAGAKRGNQGLLANPLHVDLAKRDSLSRTILGLSRTSTTWVPVTATAHTFADSWGFKGYRARLKIGLNLQCHPWTWPRCAPLEMRIFPDEAGQDQVLLGWIPMGRVWVWPWRRFRIEPGAVHVDIEASLPQQPIEIHVDSKGKVTIPPGALRIEMKVKD